MYGCEICCSLQRLSFQQFLKKKIEATKYKGRKCMCHFLRWHEPQTSDITMVLQPDYYRGLRLQ